MNYTFQTNLDICTFDSFVENHPMCNLLQSSNWAKVKENWGHEIIGVYQEDTLVAGASVLIKKLPFNLTMMYIPRGPILNYGNKELVTFFFSQLKKWAKKYHCLFIKLDPGIIYKEFFLCDDVREINSFANIAIENLKKVGCVHLGFTTSLDETIQPRFHASVKKCENYMDTLPKHTKRHIKTAQKKNITVNSYGVEKINEFSRLMKLTEERKQISLRNEEYFEKLMNIFKDDCKLFLAQINLNELLTDSQKRLDKLNKDIDKCKEGQEAKKENFMKERDVLVQDIENLELYKKEDGDNPYVAGALCVYFGNTCEMLYMGMDNKYQKFHGAYLSHIGPIQYAQEHDIEWCNMGGLEGTLDGGLTKFKSNFNPTILEYIGEFDFPVNTLLYKVSSHMYKKMKTGN